MPTRTRTAAGRAMTLAGALALTMSWCALGAASASAEGCPNEAFRVGAAANLPNCRAYEQVSPVDKGSYDITFGQQALATNGNSITYDSFGSFAGADNNNVLNQYLSTRGPSGWGTEAISPPIAPWFQVDSFENYLGFSDDLSRMVLEHVNPPFDGATPNVVNLYLRDADGSLHLITIGVPAGSQNPPDFIDASADYSHIVFEDKDRLTPDAPVSNGNVYEWVNGQLSLVNVLPNGTAFGSPGTAACAGQSFFTGFNAISADGSRIYWNTGCGGSASSPIYLRQGGSSIEITISQCSSKPSCTSGSGVGLYWTESSDGATALFTSPEQLTNDSTATNAGPGNEYGDLYQYDANTGHLADLTVDPSDPYGADVQGVLGASGDGSYVYFVAAGVLASGATAGQPNLYLRHAGTTTFIATLDPNNDGSDWDENANAQQSLSEQVSADGLHALFTSDAPLSPGYDNAGRNEVYLYSASSGVLTCVSCNPTGVPATGGAGLADGIGYYLQFANLATVHNMSADGARVFFESADALLPQDSNGLENVYEWEADGTGGCQTAADNGGCLYSISSGRASSPSYFEDSSASGEDVFFLTREQLVAQDTDQNVDLYDARVGGGFPQPAPQPAPCVPEDCHGQPASALTTPTVASVTFSGLGNLAPNAKARPRLTRAQKLAKALRACRKRPKRQRKRCQSEARRRFGARGASAIRGAK